MLVDGRQDACASPSKAPGRVRPIACAACRAASSRRRVALFFRPGGRPGPAMISDALGLGCRRREAHDPTLLILYGVKIPHMVSKYHICCSIVFVFTTDL